MQPQPGHILVEEQGQPESHYMARFYGKKQLFEFSSNRIRTSLAESLSLSSITWHLPSWAAGHNGTSTYSSSVSDTSHHLRRTSALDVGSSHSSEHGSSFSAAYSPNLAMCSISKRSKTTRRKKWLWTSRFCRKDRDHKSRLPQRVPPTQNANMMK